MCACAHLCMSVSQSFNFPKLQNDQLQHNFIETNYLRFFLWLIWCSEAVESAKHSGTRIFLALHHCPSSRPELSGSTEALTEWHSHKWWPSALHESFGETNLITISPCCLSVFLVWELLQFELQWRSWGTDLDFPYIHVIRFTGCLVCLQGC